MQTVVSVFSVAVAGCTSNEKWSAGDLRIDNNDSTEHAVRVRISETVPNEDAQSSTPTPVSDLNYRLDERYRVGPGTTKIGSVAESSESGHVKVIATMESGAEIERWITLPTRYIWEIDIASDGTLTWAYYGLE